MRIHAIIISFLLLLNCENLKAQDTLSIEYTDQHSYQLYEEGNWNQLIQFGNKAIKRGVDFTYLRLRLGYAAVQNKNYSEALLHYQHILIKDKYNETARYYVWYCREYLNQSEAAVYNALYFSKETIQKEKLNKYKIKSIGIESSYKTTNNSNRGNSFYNRLNLNTQLGWRFNMNQSAVLFNQTINEKFLTLVNRNDSIVINQKEYYNLLTFNVDHHLQLKAAYHYLYTPNNNIIYRNHISMLGIKYLGNHVNIQGSILLGKITDTGFKQYEIQADYYPTGNLNFYTSTNISFREWSGEHQINLKQIVGLKLNQKIWLEGNVTLGKFSNRTENDGLYVYNAVDPNLFKGGVTFYFAPNKHLLLQIGTLAEKRELYYTNYIFNQQSINGGITWKF
jgi:hypothetical protein